MTETNTDQNKTPNKQNTHRHEHALSLFKLFFGLAAAAFCVFTGLCITLLIAPKLISESFIIGISIAAASSISLSITSTIFFSRLRATETYAPVLTQTSPILSKKQSPSPPQNIRFFEKTVHENTQRQNKNIETYQSPTHLIRK